MKKIINTLAVAAIALAGLWSCSRVELEPVAKAPESAKVTLEAVLADAQATKTAVTDAGKVLWNPGDSIMVFFGNHAVPFFSYNAAPSDKALFMGTSLVLAASNEDASGSLGDYTYWGVYPQQTRKAKYIPVRDNESVYAYVDALQVAKAGTFDNSTFPTIACSNDWRQLSFYNLCGGIRFKVTARDIDIVTFKGNNGEKLAGEVSVKMDGDGHPYPAEIYSIQNELQLRAPKGETFKPGVWYYIVSLPATLSKGYTMNFISSATGRMATKTTRESVTIKRSVFGELTDADSGLQWSAGFDESELAGMEDAIEIVGVEFDEDMQYPLLKVVYHDRYLQQLVERAGMKFVVYNAETYELGDKYYVMFSASTRMENGSHDSYYLQSLYSYEEMIRLQVAMSKFENQMYMATAPGDIEDLRDPSLIKIFKLEGADSRALNNSEYLSSSEDGTQHYFFCNRWIYDQHGERRVTGVYALIDKGDRFFVKQVLDASSSLVLKNGYNAGYRWLHGRFYVVGQYENTLMIEAFTADGGYETATLENTSLNIDYVEGIYTIVDNTYAVVSAYNENGNGVTAVLCPVYEPELGFGQAALLKGWSRSCYYENDCLVVSSSENWCVISPSGIEEFEGRLEDYQFRMIKEYGRVYSLERDSYANVVSLVTIDMSTLSVKKKAIEVPAYSEWVDVYFSYDLMYYTLIGYTPNGYVTATIDCSTGEVSTENGRYYPYSYDWRDDWYFEHKDIWSVIGSWYGDTYWETDYVMQSLESSGAEGEYSITMYDLQAGDEFKFRNNGSWDENLGCWNGIYYSEDEGAWVGYLEDDAPNIVIPSSGDWIISLDLNSSKVTLVLL